MRTQRREVTIVKKRSLPELNGNIQEVEIIDNGPGVPVHHHRLPQIGFNRLIPSSESRGKDSSEGRKR
jgi:nitrogen-specific signal transduction histidine kinase